MLSARSYQNVDARIYGGEFLASYILTRNLSISTDLSYIRGTRDVVPSQGILTPDLAEIPPMRSSTRIRYVADRYSAEIEGTFSGEQRDVDTSLGERKTPGYGLANIRASTHFWKMHLRLALNNLFNRAYYEHLSYQRDPFRSGALVYEPGRNFYINISFRH
ncbi:MAG: TonB-dependent receptor [Acidobacteriota bacterium]